MSADQVVLERDAATGVARLRLTRPEAHNAIGGAFVRELHDAVERLARDADGLRAVLLEADGPSFTVGGDLRHFRDHLDGLSDELVRTIEPFHAALHGLAELPAPVVCAAQGAVAGGGIGLLWSADVVIAADDVRFVTGFAKLGVSGDGGSTWYLPRTVGLRRAQALMLESPTLDAAQALEWGLVTRVVPRAELADEAVRTTARLAEGPTRALATQRRLLRAADRTTLAEGLAAELAGMRETGATSDAAEGFAAFVERRTPRFDGG